LSFPEKKSLSKYIDTPPRKGSGGAPSYREGFVEGSGISCADVAGTLTVANRERIQKIKPGRGFRIMRRPRALVACIRVTGACPVSLHLQIMNV
jgi:hypothetical protein